MYYLSRFLRLKLLGKNPYLPTAQLQSNARARALPGDTIDQHEVNRDTAVIARIFACVNLFVDVAAAIIYTVGLYESRGEFEIFIALLDVAMTASWVCVCLIPLELYCSRRKQEGEVRDRKNQEKYSQVEDARVADEKAPLLGTE